MIVGDEADDFLDVGLRDLCSVIDEILDGVGRCPFVEYLIANDVRRNGRIFRTLKSMNATVFEGAVGDDADLEKA